MAPSTVTLSVRADALCALNARLDAFAAEATARGGQFWPGHADASWLLNEMRAEVRRPKGVRAECYGDEVALVLSPRLLALADALEALLEDTA